MRSLALAQAWIDDGATVHWLASDLLPPSRDRLSAEGINLEQFEDPVGEEEDSDKTLRFANSVNADWVVLDGYAFGALHQAMLKRAGRHVLFVDDNGHAAEYPADIVLNQNMHASRALYEGKSAGALLLLGPHYALLRREFRRAPRSAKTIPRVARNILVTLGGGGNAPLAGKIVDALRDLAPARGLQVKLIAGGAGLLGEGDRGGTGDWLSFSRYTEDMLSAMVWADLAISAAGTTACELMMLGVPSLLIVAADNQRPIADRLHEMGIGENLGPADTLDVGTISRAVEELAVDPSRRRGMSERGHAAIDGEGAPRVVRAMRAGLLRLRPARVDDMRVLWEWANDPEARAVSFSPAAIPWEDHARWFKTHLGDAGYRILIAETREAVPVGTVRFERDGEDAVISVSVDRSSRREGYGRWLIRLGSLEILRSPGVYRIRAYIKPDNAASIRAFESAGFRYHAPAAVRGQAALLYTFPEDRP